MDEECDVKYDITSFKPSNNNSSDPEKDIIVLDDDDFIQTTLSLFDTNVISANQTTLDNSSNSLNINNHHSSDDQINFIDLTSCDDFDLNDIFLIGSNTNYNPTQIDCLNLKKEAILEIKSEIDFKSFSFTTLPEVILIDDEEPEETESIDDQIQNDNQTLNNDLLQSSINKNSETVSHPSDYRCQICLKEFNKLYNYKRHVFLHKAKSNELDNELSNFKINQCPKCNKKIIDTSNYYKHLKICSPENHKILKIKKYTNSTIKKNDFKCEICEKNFNKKFNYNRHMRIHFLNEVRNQNQSLNSEHSEQSDGKIQLYECDKCSRKFTTKELLKSHLEKWHFGNYQCKFCTEKIVFNEKYEFIKHLNINHSIKFKLECKFCKKTFRFVSQYIQHRQSHLNQMRFKEDAGDFDDNEKIISDDKLNLIKCNICFKTFSKTFNLKRHMKSIHTRHNGDYNTGILLNNKLNYDFNLRQKVFYQQNKLNFHLNKINLNK